MNYDAPLMLAHQVMGPDRILFAIDYPFEEAEEPVRVMDAAPIPDEDRRKIYHRNAERVFRLGGLEPPKVEPRSTGGPATGARADG